jgi:hypothetical protein
MQIMLKSSDSFLDFPEWYAKVKPRARVQITSVFYDIFMQGHKRGKDKKKIKKENSDWKEIYFLQNPLISKLTNFVLIQKIETHFLIQRTTRWVEIHTASIQTHRVCFQNT